MMDEIRALGFPRVELSHGIRVSLVEGIQRALKKEASLRVESLHNFCPLPVQCMHAAPNAYLFSSEDDFERQKAIRQTLVTLDFAASLGARFVVLHLGAVAMGHPTRDLARRVEQGQRDTPAYRALLGKMLARRQDKGRKPFARTMKSLEQLAEAARERKVVLAVESRYRLEEIPSEMELEEVLAAFPSEVLGYWHDTGHVQVWHHLGLADHAAWLRKFQGRLVGGHVHDTSFPGHDHRLPGRGSVPFDDLTALRRPDILKVFEFEPGMPSDELKQALPAFMEKFENSKS